jgi:tyrosyl-tRNA synthetase
MPRYDLEWTPPDQELIQNLQVHPLIDLVAELMNCSKSDARRLIESRAVSLDDAILDHTDIWIEANNVIARVKIGKRNHFRVVFCKEEDAVEPVGDEIRVFIRGTKKVKDG